MTPQLKLVTAGAIVVAASKFYFGKTWQLAGLYGLAAVAVIAVLTAKKSEI